MAAPSDSGVRVRPALVVLVNNQCDWQRVVEQGWYRIPLQRAPLPVAALDLAFYRTRAFGTERWQITFIAPVLRYDIMPRRALLPDEPNHPRAAELYYRIALGPVERLVRPIPSRRLRRITFIPTTLERLRTARDVTDLWLADDAATLVWGTFRDAALKATRRLALDPASLDELGAE